MIASGDTLKSLSSMSHNSLFHDSLDQPTSNSMYFQPSVSSSKKEQGGCILHVKEKMLKICSIFLPSLKKIIFHLWLIINIVILITFQMIPNFIQVEAFDNHHHEIYYSTNTCGDECRSKWDDIFSSSEDLDLQGINP